jgi:hypothetical protein
MQEDRIIQAGKAYIHEGFDPTEEARERARMTGRVEDFIALVLAARRKSQAWECLKDAVEAHLGRGSPGLDR